MSTESTTNSSDDPVTRDDQKIAAVRCLSQNGNDLRDLGEFLSDTSSRLLDPNVTQRDKKKFAKDIANVSECLTAI